MCKPYHSSRWRHMSVKGSQITGNSTDCSTAWQADIKIKAPHHCQLYGGNTPVTDGLPHKGPVMRKAFPCYNVLAGPAYRRNPSLFITVLTDGLAGATPSVSKVMREKLDRFLSNLSGYQWLRLTSMEQMKSFKMADEISRNLAASRVLIGNTKFRMLA